MDGEALVHLDLEQGVDEVDAVNADPRRAPGVRGVHEVRIRDLVVDVLVLVERERTAKAKTNDIIVIPQTSLRMQLNFETI